MRRPRAGLCKDIGRADLRNTAASPEVQKVGWRKTLGDSPPPTSTILHQPPHSDSKWYRRERDDEEEERDPREHASRPGQRPLRVEDGRVTQATAGEDEHEEPPVQPAAPEPTEYDDEDPESKRDALLPARQRRIQDMAAVELRNGQEVQHGHEHAKPTRERDGVDEQGGCRPVGKGAEQQRDE